MFNYEIFRLGEFLALHFPISFSYFLAKVISRLQSLLAKQDVYAVKGNLKSIFPEIEDSRLDEWTRSAFLNFGKYLVEFFRFKKIGADFIEKNIVIEGLKNIDNALSGGKGVILVSAHLGNWELGAAVLGILGYPVHAVALPHKDEKVNNFFNRQREIKGVRIIPLGRAGRACLEVINKNEILCLVGDRDFSGSGIITDFFGKPSLIPRGPAAFALKNQTPIVVCYVARQVNGKFRFFLNPPIHFKATGNYEQDILSLTGIYLEQLESGIIKYPDQWCMFRKFWAR